MAKKQTVDDKGIIRRLTQAEAIVQALLSDPAANDPGSAASELLQRARQGLQESEARYRALLAAEQAARAETEAAATALRARERQQATVAELGQLALSGELPELMDRSVALIAETLAVEYCEVLELRPDGKLLLLRSGVGWQPGLVGRATVGVEGDSQAGYTLVAAKPVVVEDVRTEGRFSGPPLLHEHGVVSGLSVVIPGRERPFGVLGAHTRARRAFTDDDVHFLQAVASMLATAIERKRSDDQARRQLELLTVATVENARLYEAEQRARAQAEETSRVNTQLVVAATEARQRVEALLDATKQITSSLDLATTLNSIMDNIVRLSGADFAGILLPDPTGQVLRYEVTRGPSAALFRGLSFRLGEGFPGIAAKTGAVVSAPDARADHRPAYPQIAEMAGIGSAIFAPLRTGKAVTGVLAACSEQPGHFTPARERLLLGLADQAALAIEHAREIAVREEAEAEIRRLNEDLERRVSERTAQLEAVIHDLEAEVAERKRAELQLRLNTAALASAANAIVITDHTGMIKWANPAFTRLTGYAVEEAIGQNPRFLKSDQQDEPYYRQLWQTIVAGQVWRGEIVNRRKDGSFYTEEMTITPVRDERGEIANFIAIKQDVSDRKRAEAAIKELNEDLLRRAADLAAANKELEAFSYSVSHDLRAPLRAMDGFSRILLEDYGAELSAEARRYLGLVRDNAQQMGRLIDDLLAFSRLGRQPLNKQPIDPKDIVRQVLATVAAEQAGGRVEVVIGDLPSCLADPGLLRQVFANLLDNAFKFSRGRDPAVIEVGWREEHGEVAYFVKDNGAGFDMRYAGKLFGVFQRLHRADEYEGTGVGLATVQRIVHRHEGRVWAEAEVDRGAIFYFTLGGPDV